ncbi:MAG: hypothetical protein ACLFU8_02545 [Anaerolineales bacterium]
MVFDTRSTAEQREALERARQTTLSALVELNTETISQLSHLTLPEIEEIQEEIAQVLPAGNLPAFILSGLVKLKERRVRSEKVREDVHALMQGMNLLPQGLYSLFVAGPAAVLYGYQKILRLAGKEPENAFPQGTWQFYLQFGLREDTARHANETLGFQRTLPPTAGEVQMAAAWLVTAIDLLYEYEDLLAADWRERVMLRLLYEVAAEADLAEGPQFAKLVREWDCLRPYHRPSPEVDYFRYRLETFELFFRQRLEALPPALQQEVRKRYARRQVEDLAPYLEQMTFLASLTPGRYQEEKQSVPLWQACVGFVHDGQTYLLPAHDRDSEGRPRYDPVQGQEPRSLYVTESHLRDAEGRAVRVDRRGRVLDLTGGDFLGTLRRPPPEAVLGWAAAILDGDEGARSPAPVLDLLLAEAPRREQVKLRGSLPPENREALARLGCAPVILNWDLRPADRPLTEIRRSHRGVGDHALTLFRTARSIVFDQSHIFFDGIWGMAVAEIATDHALHTYRALEGLTPSFRMAPTPLSLHTPAGMVAEIRSRCHCGEVCVESDQINLQGIDRLRRWLSQRGVNLTVNDLLLLYRSLHAAGYAPTRVEGELQALKTRLLPEDYEVVRAEIEETLARYRETNPALLIPMDASNVSPHERLFPTTFRNPLTEIPQLFTETQTAYLLFRQQGGEEAWERFDGARRKLLAYLQAFGGVLQALKDVTMRGESFSTATLRLLGHLPSSMQYVLDSIPQRITVLNEIIKGNEVFSNVGRVAKESTLHRFISAKDDGQAKELVWGIMTDDRGVMHISLRDFRPFVGPLMARSEEQVARALAQDYLDQYVRGLNRFVDVLGQLVAVRGPRA